MLDINLYNKAELWTIMKRSKKVAVQWGQAVEFYVAVYRLYAVRTKLELYLDIYSIAFQRDRTRL